jgi:hypothetical protein
MQNNLWDLANSCEYFTTEKICNAIAENEKAQTNRKAKCENTDTTSCCYLCPSRPRCTISCNYLGNPDATHVSVRSEDALIENIINEAKELQETKIINNQGNQDKYCPVCNVEMSETKTELRVDKWKGLKPTMPSADILPILVYLCPQCGKIEFKADRREKDQTE